MKRTLAVLVALVLVVSAIAALAARQQPDKPNARVMLAQGEDPLPPPPGPGPGPGGPPPGFIGGPGPGGPQMFRPMAMCPVGAVASPPPPMMQTLELSDEQREKLRDVMMKSDQTQRPIREQAMKASQGLREALAARDYDAAKVQQFASAATKAEADLVSAGINTWTQIRDILTEDQLAKLSEMMKRGPMMGPRGPAGPGGPGGQPPQGQGNSGGGFGRYEGTRTGF